MLSRIASSSSVRAPLHYNEEKVTQGKARFIGADNFLKAPQQLTLQDKFDRFDQRAELNENVGKKAVHFSLNFGAAEQLSDDRLLNLAGKYMKGMGFEDQPWLAYRHTDAGHTHIHIVSTSIQADGSKIRLGPPQLAKSHGLTKQLETEFSLQPNVKAAAADQAQFHVTNARKVLYGQRGLKHSISDVLNTVIDHYNYTNLDELNAVLRLYNVNANPGEEQSRLRQRHGLLYHALDDSGNRIGVSLKASSFLVKPTLSRLEQRFIDSVARRESVAKTLRNTIDWTLAGEKPDWSGLKKDLNEKGVALIMSPSVQDHKSRLYFIDHNQKAVFDAELLGKAYNLQSLQHRCAPTVQPNQQEESQIQQTKIRL